MNITICVPVYNEERTIESAIQSVRNAKLKNYEILISDNASTDRTKKICLKLKNKYPRLISYFQNSKNIGFAENYKICIKKARGKYIFFIGADDFLIPKNINNLIIELEKQPKVNIACSDIYTFNHDPQQKEKLFIFFSGKKKLFEKGDNALSNWLFHSATGSIGGYLMRSAEAKKYCQYIPPNSYVPQIHLTAYMSIYSNVVHLPLFSFAQRLTESSKQMANKQYLSLRIIKEILSLIKNVSKVNKKVNKEEQTVVKQKMIHSYTSCLTNNIISYKVFSSFSTVAKLIKLLVRLDQSIIFKPRFLIFTFVSLLIPQFILKKMLFSYRRIKSK